MLSKFPRISLRRTGQNIYHLMKEHNLSVKDVQEAVGFEYPQAVYKWIRGESLPSIDNLVVLALLFKTTIDKIVVIED